MLITYKKWQTTVNQAGKYLNTAKNCALCIISSEKGCRVLEFFLLRIILVAEIADGFQFKFKECKLKYDQGSEF